MKSVRIKRFATDLPLPEYKTKGAAAFDFVARETVSIKAGAVGYIPLNVVVEAPANHFMLLFARSSTHKLGLMPANGVGIIDSDYCGDGDEIMFVVLNFTKKSVIVSRGTRIAQGMFVKCDRVKWREVGEMKKKTRGGFGSTGLR